MEGLQLYSYVLDENTIDDVNLYVFKLPNEVREKLEEINSYKDKYKTTANKAIFKVAATIFDKIIYSNNTLNDIKYNDNIWFYSTEEIDLNLLRVKIQEWIVNEQESIDRQTNIEFKEEWNFSGKISLKEILTGKHGVKFNLIPSYYIYKLASQEFDFRSLDRKLKFYRVIDDAAPCMITKPSTLHFHI